jgi:hypothetical protein
MTAVAHFGCEQIPGSGACKSDETRRDPKSAPAGIFTGERERTPSQYCNRLGKVAMFQALGLYLENMETITDSLGSQKRTPEHNPADLLTCSGLRARL